MENASKALIIAGAILLSILLISLGIMIFTQAQNVVNGSGMDEAQKTAFNAKFTKYEGTQKGAMVRAMVQDVLAANATAADNNITPITIAGDAGVTAEDTSQITNTRNYKIVIHYDSTSGLVSSIDVNN